MATARLIGKLGGADFETITVDVSGYQFTASCPAGWESCWAVAQGTTRYPDKEVDIFGRRTRTESGGRWFSASTNNIGGSIALAAGQTSDITGGLTGTVTYIRTG